MNLCYDGSANDGLNPMSKFESCESLLNSRQRTSFIMHLSLLVESLLMTLLAIPTASQNISPRVLRLDVAFPTKAAGQLALV